MPTVFDRATAVHAQAQSAPPSTSEATYSNRSDGAPRATFAVDISPDWRAGRGPHGGYLAAMLLRALIDTVDDPARSPRSLTIHYASPSEPGPAVIHTVIERQGRSLSTLSARLEQNGVVRALALAAFSVPWKATDANALPMPELPGPDLERRSTPHLFDGAPPFTRQLVLQPRRGAIPFTGADAPMEIGGWIALPEPRPVDALSLALFCDAWFPPAFIALSAPAVSPTVDLTIHFRRPLPAEERDPEEMCLSLFTTRVLHEGFFEEDGVVWGADGTVLAQSRQLGLVIPVPSQ
jgi:acyl-CoA thioesterase